MPTSPKSNAVRWATGIMLVAAAPPAYAHDSWLVAEKSYAEPGDTVRLAFVSAETFPISEHATEPNRVQTWTVHHADQSRPITGFHIDGQELVAAAALDNPGLHVLAIALRPRFIELSPEDFERYLRDEEAERVLRLRNQSGASDKPGHEYYAKHAKAFVQVGAPIANDRSFAEPVGHPLEIIPLTNPCAWAVNEEIAVRVLRKGRPVAGLRVSAGREGLGPHEYVDHVKTDDQGIARFKLTHPGLWFLRTHTIFPTAPGRSSNLPDTPPADWQSWWTSITFRVQTR